MSVRFVTFVLHHKNVNEEIRVYMPTPHPYVSFRACVLLQQANKRDSDSDPNEITSIDAVSRSCVF